MSWDKQILFVMQTYSVSKPDSNLFGQITLSPSKSISNRDIVIRALKNSKFDIKTVSEKDAAKVFAEEIRKGEVTLDAGDPAKAIRLLRAFLTYFKGDWIVTGSAEMHKRPVGDVIDMLQELGINIRYIEREGFPPLKIIGKAIKSSIIRVDADICSQFINTSLLISPALSSDDVVDLKNRVISSPYINQTLRLLRYLGINSNWDKDEILIEHDLHAESALTVEADWLSASYWYQMAAISSQLDFCINGLNPESAQSDAIVKELFEPLGVKTTPTSSGVKLSRTDRKINHFKYDFSSNPHLIPTMVATCIGINLPFSFAGIEVMNYFEPNRKMALQLHMQKFGAKLTIEKRGEFETMHFDGKTVLSNENTLEFNHLDDHRLVMALAALTPMGSILSIENPRLVSKSYPCFWDDLRKVGFTVE
jgi:3-phosphoshikimate 1-carboxyvinyltransferase